MESIPQCSPTGNDLPFSVWTIRVHPLTGEPMQSEASAVFSYLPEALDYIAYLGERNVACVLRGMYGNVSEYPAARARLLASERRVERAVLADAGKDGIRIPRQKGVAPKGGA